MADERQQHRSFWDCYELETGKRRAYRRVSDDTAESGLVETVEVKQCSECGAMWVVEVFHEDDEYLHDVNFYGLKDSATVEGVLESYGLEGTGRWSPA